MLYDENIHANVHYFNRHYVFLCKNFQDEQLSPLRKTGDFFMNETVRVKCKLLAVYRKYSGEERGWICFGESCRRAVAGKWGGCRKDVEEWDYWSEFII
jgi:hypothetical protein